MLCAGRHDPVWGFFFFFPLSNCWSVSLSSFSLIIVFSLYTIVVFNSNISWAPSRAVLVFIGISTCYFPVFDKSKWYSGCASTENWIDTIFVWNLSEWTYIDSAFVLCKYCTFDLLQGSLKQKLLFCGMATWNRRFSRWVFSSFIYSMCGRSLKMNSVLCSTSLALLF